MIVTVVVEDVSFTLRKEKLDRECQLTTTAAVSVGDLLSTWSHGKCLLIAATTGKG